MAVLSLILAINFISMRCDSELQIYIHIEVKPHSPHYYYMSLLHLSLNPPTSNPSSLISILQIISWWFRVKEGADCGEWFHHPRPTRNQQSDTQGWSLFPADIANFSWCIWSKSLLIMYAKCRQKMSLPIVTFTVRSDSKNSLTNVTARFGKMGKIE